MTKGFFIFVFFFHNFCNSSVILPDDSTKNLTVIDEVLITLLTECNLWMKNVMFYDGANTDLLNILSTIPPPKGPESWILQSQLRLLEHKEIGNSVVIDGYVVVLNSYDELEMALPMMIYTWQCSKNCTVVFLCKLPDGCNTCAYILRTMGYAHFDITYYICLDEQKIPRVITQDPYGNIQPSRWQPINMPVSFSCPWTLYHRRYNKNLCRDFHFNRSAPKEDGPIMIGALNVATKGGTVYPDAIYHKNIDQLPRKLFSSLFPFLGRLLKIKFTVYVRSLPMGSKEIGRSSLFFWSKTSADILSGYSVMWEDIRFVWSYPTTYSPYVILSHNPGLATPLEKIAQFYGIWTLISLIIILSVTFVVIYLITNRHTASAAFDCFSLLKNSRVTVPINTLSLKIFFCVVFLYFMVIHATFSGNLAKFLTIPQIRDYPNSMKDLANPQITTIFILENKGRFAEKNDTIFKKIKSIKNNQAAFDEFIRDQNSVFIIPRTDASVFLYNTEFLSKICVSRNDFGHTMGAIRFRRRFFHQEKFNWAITYIFDIHVDIQREQIHLKNKRRLERQKARSEVNFRSIAIKDLKFAFIFWSIGNILGLICFVIELVIGRKYYQSVNCKNSPKVKILTRRKQRIKVRRIVVNPKPMANDVSY